VDVDPLILYRRALGSFATGVTVVTADDAAGPVGITANSFTSVSLEPPLVLWCLGDDSARHALFAATPRFVINVLPAEARALADRFAWGDARLTPEEVARGASGAPGLEGVLTRLECETRKRIRLGDHLAIVGEVTGFHTLGGDGLVFFRGTYGRATDPIEPARLE
jgi:flavin reductase (DIM6/NTAB) family NADH-FMN oxidoreductase RutF